MNYKNLKSTPAIIKHGAKLLIFSLICWGYSSTSLALNINDNSLKGMSRAYGFLVAQDNGLARISKEFPKLSPQVDAARAEFEANFPDIKAKIESQLNTILSKSDFENLNKTLNAKLYESIGNAELTNDLALNFIQQVENSAKGEIESPVLEYLLAVKYADSPVSEFKDGFVTRYKTDTTGKSQGLMINMAMPKSWLGKSSDFPHVVRGWSSENGTGLESIALQVHDAKGIGLTKNEAISYVKSGEVKEVVTEPYKFLKAGNFSLEKQNGFWVEMSGVLERAGINIYQQSIMYTFLFNEKSVSITCTASGSPKDVDKTKLAYTKLKPLCQQVLNSVTLPQAY